MPNREFLRALDRCLSSGLKVHFDLEPDFWKMGTVGTYDPLDDLIWINGEHPLYFQGLFHELIHWTGAAHRLNRASALPARLVSRTRMAKEECIAFVGESLLSTRYGLPPVVHVPEIKFEKYFGWALTSEEIRKGHEAVLYIEEVLGL